MSTAIVGTYGVVGLNERVVDGDDINLAVLNGISEDDATNAAKAVNSNLGDSHDSAGVVSGVKIFTSPRQITLKTSIGALTELDRP